MSHSSSGGACFRCPRPPRARFICCSSLGPSPSILPAANSRAKFWWFQALVGDVPREAGIVRAAESGTSAWRQEFDFGEFLNSMPMLKLISRVGAAALYLWVRNTHRSCPQALCDSFYGDRRWEAGSGLVFSDCILNP